MSFAINKVLSGYIIADLLFLLGGIILLLGSRLGEASLHHERNVENVMRSLLIPRCPIIRSSSALLPTYLKLLGFANQAHNNLHVHRYIASLANAICVFAAFLCSIPVIVFPQNGRWLRLHGWLLVFSGIFTLSLGLSVWYEALRTRSTLQPMWSKETGDIRGLLQKKVRHFYASWTWCDCSV